MEVLMVQSKIKAEGVADVQAAVKKVLVALDAAQPEGLRYASCLVPDGETFVAHLQIDDGVEKPTPGSPRIQGDVGDRRALACRAPRRSTADGHRLLPVLLRTTATHVPVRGPFEVSQMGAVSCLMDVVDPSDEGVSDESVCGGCDWSDR